MKFFILSVLISTTAFARIQAGDKYVGHDATESGSCSISINDFDGKTIVASGACFGKRFNNVQMKYIYQDPSMPQWKVFSFSIPKTNAGDVINVSGKMMLDERNDLRSFEIREDYKFGTSRSKGSSSFEKIN